MIPAYTAKLGLSTRKTSVRAQIINGLPLETYGVASARISIQNSLGRVWFFEKTFLLADTSIEVVLRICFLSLNNADVKFAELGELTWRTYAATEALSTISRVEFINKRKFAKAALHANLETFVIYMSALEATKGPTIHLSWAAQITVLQWDKVPTKVLAKHADYIDIFSFDLALELSENTGINKHTIKLIVGKQPPYGPIYTLNPVELDTLKAYIGTHLKTEFIQLFKSLVGAPILFDKKLDGILHLYVDYQDLKNLTIKNRYLLLQIGETLDRLGRAK